MFYYQNQFGSKVFFDELGGEWQKHDCSKQSSPMRFSHPHVILIKKPISRRGHYEISGN
jgi:hypothetical protein